MSAQWSVPVLKHTAQSTYKPELSPSELAAWSDLRVEGISELSVMIVVSSAKDSLVDY
jgi:hypothetical protein